jgi:hypothetical protein
MWSADSHACAIPDGADHRSAAWVDFREASRTIKQFCDPQYFTSRQRRRHKPGAGDDSCKLDEILRCNTVDAAISQSASHQFRRSGMQRRSFVHRMNQDVAIEQHRHAYLLVIDFVPRQRSPHCALNASQRIGSTGLALAVFPGLYVGRQLLHLLIFIVSVHAAWLPIADRQHQRTALLRSQHDSPSHAASHHRNGLVRHTSSGDYYYYPDIVPRKLESYRFSVRHCLRWV